MIPFIRTKLSHQLYKGTYIKSRFKQWHLYLKFVDRYLYYFNQREKLFS